MTKQEWLTIRGARDMLSESAKQHRQRDDTGHATECEIFVECLNSIISTHRAKYKDVLRSNL